MTQQRFGITVPFEGVPLHEHREWYEEAEALGYTDVIDMSAIGAHDWREWFRALPSPQRGRMIVEPEAFYVFASK